MNIFYALDSGFDTALVVSVNSLIKNTVSPLNFFIVYDDIQPKRKEYFESLQSDRVKIFFLSSPIVDESLKPDRGGKSQFYRLYIPKLLKKFKNIKEVLYLDCDTLITSNEIEQIFNFDMKDFVIAAAMDPWGKAYKKFFGLKETTPMFNDGVFLLNLVNWDKNNMDLKLKKILEQEKYFPQADQGVLNRLLAGNFGILSPRFNVITSYFEMNYGEILSYRKPIHFYSKNEIEEAKKNPIIVHFTSTFLCNRPWQIGNINPFKDQWLYILKNNLSSNNSIVFDKIDIKHRLIRKAFYKLPRKFVIKNISYMQNFIRPLFIKIYCTLK